MLCSKRQAGGSRISWKSRETRIDNGKFDFPAEGTGVAKGKFGSTVKGWGLDSREVPGN
jgi:hypothetical protein